MLVPQGPSKRVSLDFPLDVYDTRDDLTGKHFKWRYHIISAERSTAKDTWFGFDDNLTHDERVMLGIESISTGHQDRDSVNDDGHVGKGDINNTRPVEESDIESHKGANSDDETHDTTRQSRSMLKSNGMFLLQD